MSWKSVTFRLIHQFVEIIARGIFTLVAFVSGPAKSQPPIQDNTLLYSASTLAFMIRNKQLTSEEVVQSYINRIKEIQPILNCVVEDRFEEALIDAKKCDEILRSENAPSAAYLSETLPFFGVPFTTKDCIAVANMKQTAGLVARKNVRAKEDATVITLLKKAGAIPLAITNVSELAMWWESSNCLYGTTRNPYNTRHIVGGSSGGEGCLQAAAGSPFGIGSDIGGSIRMPCFFNGIFGHKPTKGCVCTLGHYPDVVNEDQTQLLAIGPMCRYAEDLKPILQILTTSGNGKDPLQLSEKVDISKLKFYYMEDDGGQYFVSPVDPEIKNAMREVLMHFQKTYNVEVTKINVKKFKKSIALWLASMTSKDEKDFAYELANRTGSLNLWWELLRRLLFMSDHTFIALFTAMFEKFGVKHGSEQHKKLMQESKELQQEMKDLLKEDGVFFYPTHPTAAPLHHEPLVKPFNFSYTAIINVLGLPTTACPLGCNKDGLPIGIQVVGGMYQDRVTIAIAEEIEKVFKGWVPPPVV